MEDRPSGAPADAIEAAFLIVFGVVAAVSWVGITLAELDLFRPALLWPLALAAAAISVWLIWRSSRPALVLAPTPPARVSVMLAALLLAAGVLFFKPGEVLFNGNDASMYLAMGETISKNAGIQFVDPLVALIPDAARPALFMRDRNWPPLLDRFEGGLQIADGQPLVVPNFFHLLPVWAACLTLLFGAGGGGYVNPAAAVLSVWAIWLLGRRVSGPIAGWVAAALLVVNFGEIWYARYASSEMLCQFFVLAGLVFSVMATDRGPRIAGACAGAAFGLAAFCRIDALLLVSPVIAGLLALAWYFDRFPSWRAYALTFLVLTAHAVLHALTLSRPYTLRVLVEGSTWLGARSLLVGAAVGVVVALLLALRSSPALRTRVHAIALPALAPFAVPVVALGGLLTSAGYFGWLLSPAGVVLAFAGLAFALSRDLSPRTAPAVALFLASATVYLDRARGQIAMPLTFRRLIPVILPLALLFLAHLIARLAARRPAGRVVLAVPIVLGGWFLFLSWPVIVRPPMRGVRAEVEQLAQRFPSESLLLLDRSVPSHLGVALESAFGRDVLIVRRLNGMSGALGNLLDRLFASGRRVFAVTQGNGTQGGDTLWRSDLERFAIQPGGEMTLRFDELRPRRDEFPREVRSVERRLEIYEVIPQQGPDQPAGLPLTLDIGELDFPAVLRGFHGRETMAAATARWTGHEADIALPSVNVPRSGPIALTIRMSAWRPAGLAPAHATVSLGGRAVGEVGAVSPGFSEYRFPLDRESAAQIRSGGAVLRLRTDTFVPNQFGVGNDARTLGVAIDWVRMDATE